jgi:KTSC domain/Protein of unknown function (DUF3006)
MTRHRDEVSPVRAARFDRATHTLRIEFANGSEYDFADVPEHLHDELARSADPDEFFRENIRDEFIGTRADDVDLARMAKERREDELLGAPLAEFGLAGPHARADNAHVRGSHHTWVVDVIEDDSAAVEIDGRQITPVPRWLLPADARSGDVLRVTHARSGARSTLTIEVDRHATRAALQQSADQMRAAPPGGEGDIDPE